MSDDKKKLELPWKEVLKTLEGQSVVCDMNDLRELNGYWSHFMVPKKHAEMFRELCRRVIKRENFDEYAKQVWRDIFEVKNEQA